MLQRFLIFIAVLAASAAVQARCLVVKDNDVNKIRTRYDLTTATWTGSVHNTCKAPYDATLTVKFEDGDGSVLYRAVQVVVLRGGREKETRRRVNIPADEYRQIRKIDVTVDEHLRPR
jgi:hypothetical protein